MADSLKLKNIALLGASGKIGPYILKALMQEPSFNVTVIARESSKGAFDQNVKVHRVSDGYTKSEMVSAFQGQDAVVVALGFAANEEHHRKFMDAAVEARVKHFIPNHWASNAEVEIVNKISARSQALDDDVDYLRTKEASGMSWTAIIPGIFFDLAYTWGLLGFDLKNKKATIWDDGNSTFSATTNDDIAKATVIALLDPQAAKNKYLFVSSFETTQNELLSITESVSGQKWAVEHVKAVDKVKEANDTIASGAKGLQWLMAQGTLAASFLFGGDEYESDFMKSGKSSNKELGFKQRDVKQAVEALL